MCVTCTMSCVVLRAADGNIAFWPDPPRWQPGSENAIKMPPFNDGNDKKYYHSITVCIIVVLVVPASPETVRRVSHSLRHHRREGSRVVQLLTGGKTESTHPEGGDVHTVGQVRTKAVERNRIATIAHCGQCMLV